MARDLTSGMKAQLTAASLTPVIFCSIQTDTTTVYFWTGLGSVSWNGHTWVGAGKFASIGIIPESGSVQANGVRLALSGIPSDMLNVALDDIRQGRPVTIYLGAMDSTPSIVADPYAMFIGRVDQVDIQDSGLTGTISINVENRLIDLQRPRQRRYEPEDQKNEFPGDLGFDFVPGLQQLNLTWGAPGAVIPQTSPGGGTVGDNGDNGNNDRFQP